MTERPGMISDLEGFFQNNSLGTFPNESASNFSKQIEDLLSAQASINEKEDYENCFIETVGDYRKKLDEVGMNPFIDQSKLLNHQEKVNMIKPSAIYNL